MSLAARAHDIAYALAIVKSLAFAQQVRVQLITRVRCQAFAQNLGRERAVKSTMPPTRTTLIMMTSCVRIG